MECIIYDEASPMPSEREWEKMSITLRKILDKQNKKIPKCKK